ncbi:MAG: hypothetical protein J6Y11_10835 [Paludibacteraceae bacterium]|nr:hypothetical protein [Paludibacteraceae bacterium]
MTVAEMKISNRERLNKLEALDPEKLNDILDYVFSKLVSMPNGEEEKKSKEKEKEKQGWADDYFGIWNDMPEETINEILSSRTRKEPIDL